ncbi:TVP38/TMEM64 family protein [soil metagenome]
MTRSTYVKAGVFVALVVAAIVLQLTVGLPSRDELQSALDGFGAAAIPAFIALYVAVCLLPVGPSGLLTIVGGALLGFAVAFVSVLIGAVIGSTLALLISRTLGRAAVQGISNERVRALDARVSEQAFGAVLLARLVPLVPFTTANYAFGLTSIPLMPYAVATALGIIPGTAIYFAVGAYGAEPGSPPFLLAIAGLVLLTVIGLVRSRRQGAGDGPAEGPGAVADDGAGKPEAEAP